MLCGPVQPGVVDDHALDDAGHLIFQLEKGGKKGAPSLFSPEQLLNFFNSLFYINVLNIYLQLCILDKDRDKKTNKAFFYNLLTTFKLYFCE